LRIVPSGLYNITDGSKEKMGPRKDDGSYCGSEEQGNWQLQSVQILQRTAPERFVKDQQESSSEATKTELGRKQVLPCEAENDLVE